MRVGTGFLVVLLFSTLPAGAVRADQTPAHADPFPRPAGLEPQVRFWRAIYAETSIHQVVLHDTLHLDKVYKVLDFRPELEDGVSLAEVDRLQRIETDLELERIRATLLRLHALGPNAEGLTAEERAIHDLFADDPAPDRFLAAADEKRLRGQRGLRERFGDGLRVSRRYLPEMERIFREEGLPVELTRLPLVESCFNLHAYSKVGAAGIWQFMPATGRRFLRVDNLVDEPAPRTHERRLDRAIGIQQAAHMAHADREQLASLNPSLSSLVVAGRRPIPRGVRLRLPESGAAGFETRLAEAPAEERI